MNSTTTPRPSWADQIQDVDPETGIGTAIHVGGGWTETVPGYPGARLRAHRVDRTFDERVYVCQDVHPDGRTGPIQVQLGDSMDGRYLTVAEARRLRDALTEVIDRVTG